MKRKADTQQVSKPRPMKRGKKKQSNQARKVYLARNIMTTADVKTHAVQLTATGMTLGSPVYQPITDTAVWNQGASQLNGYVGGRITPIGLTIRIRLTVGDAQNFVRIGVFQSEGAFSTSATNYFLTTTDMSSPISPYPIYPFITLHDKCIAMVNATETQCMFYKIYIPGKRLLPITFSSTNVVTSGMIQLLGLSDSAAAPNPAISVYSVLKYLDS